MKNNSIYVTLNTIENVRKFVDTCQSFKEEVDVSSGRYIIDAKSIMGLMSINLLYPVEVTIQSKDEIIIKDFMSKMESFKAATE